MENILKEILEELKEINYRATDGYHESDLAGVLASIDGHIKEVADEVSDLRGEVEITNEKLDAAIKKLRDIESNTNQ